MEAVAVSHSMPALHNINGLEIKTSIVHTPKTSTSEYIELNDDGIVGNATAVHDGPVYICLAENYEYWCAELGLDRSEWDWCHWGENITFRCTDKTLTESDFRLGDVWRVGSSVRLQVCGSRIPFLLRLNRLIIKRKLATMDDTENKGKNAWKGWRDLRVSRIVNEGNDDRELSWYLPGQFLTVRLPTGQVRSWSISDWPGRTQPKLYRLTIKEAGSASAWMCNECTIGTILSARSPAGRFVLDWSQPVTPRQIYLSAGIGITPILAMIKAHADHPNMRSVPGIWIHVTKDGANLQLQDEFFRIDNNPTKRIVFMTQPRDIDVCERQYSISGRPTLDTLTEILGETYQINPFGTAEMDLPAMFSAAYVCGPKDFEIDMRSILTSLKIPPFFVHSESFSSSSHAIGDLEKASVHFTKSNKTAKWEKEKSMSLLELAESVGLAPDYGCRVGACGSCAAKVTCGSVSGGWQTRIQGGNNNMIHSTTYKLVVQSKR
ncbi:uncharacterized protein B0J16DRAFT_395338 [Fusarium flagelliforme]|uniref:uncharacterized protein n=1 Tax=Fusarium flagelliforme TaxID=2675880 RepID=UPI001E8D61C9|nr:uncharacterized protein B0J16DRAFT_395338 [Fusarium flagelliforme]KAH7193387.1 hypothetical protein B0J16DRAFT_395338 [Fusarium flagelliforme]